MEPRFSRQQEHQEAELRARGWKPGDKGYDQQLADLRETQEDSRRQAMYQAQMMTGAEAQRMQGMDNASRQAMNEAIRGQLGLDIGESSYDTQQRQQQIVEELTRRGWSLNEANALISGQQVGLPSMPSFNQAQRPEATQYNQAARDQYQSSLDAFNAEQAAMAGMVGAVTSPFSFYKSFG
jgi:hypothetical protein